jgi:hypothetical protein
MIPTISYYNGVSDLHRHKSMEGQSGMGKRIETYRMPELF